MLIRDILEQELLSFHDLKQCYLILSVKNGHKNIQLLHQQYKKCLD